ncbi:MAG: 16S rRNA (cytidine(1402)-2'-O)-methyltransferase [Actinobacteria bacterium HGW-Actinobacteria-10]|jgi:16S rRNA (cytidine1402-2'-O)-methyltransferase|nr:MAG: 16S rRNA (cytidine(1402)-2'-O)-methyltransferase [Actinobacteria bacterium HGW-Actinobacteria-10]
MRDPGRLLVCATPIGNLGDVTLRVLDALRDSDLIAAEDTRVTSKLLARYEIATPIERFDENVATRKAPLLVDRMLAGETIALVSDAGTPGVSDPGARLVEAAVEAGVPVEALPGASALLAALVSSGLPMRHFYFAGFLPRKAGERDALLDRLADLDATLVFYESPKRTAATLSVLARRFPGRRAAMARELTKLHEEVARDEIGELAAALKDRPLKGEVVLLIGPPHAAEHSSADESEIAALVADLVAGGFSRKDAIKQVAADSGLPRNDVYRIAHKGPEAGAPAPADADSGPDT